MSASQSPYVGEQSSLVTLSGNTLIDTFLSGAKWGTSPAGSQASVTFGFPSSTTSYDTSAIFGYYGESSFSTYLASTDFAAFGLTEQAATREVLQAWANVANITFSEASVTTSLDATLRFNFSGSPGLGATTYGVSWFPMDIPAAGDTWINARFLYPDGWAAGTQNRLTLLHEVGHALGLKHPHDTGLAGAIDGWPATTSTLPFTESDTLTSYSTSDAVMAYNDLPGLGSPIQADFAATTPMRLDIAAFQYLYGANLSANATDTTYTYRGDGQYHQTIWDGGGSDTLMVSGTRDSVIDLTPGSWSQIGLPISYSERGADLTIVTARPELNNPNTVFIYDTVILENAAGGLGNDRLTGNGVANRLQGNAGSDVLDGGAGIDTALYSGNHSGYTLSLNSEQWSLQDLSGNEGTDTMVNVERLYFIDEMVALDLSGNAGQVAKLLGAVFGPAAIANRDYVGIGLYFLDAGTSYNDLAQLAINATGAATPAQVVDLLWTNVVGNAPSSAQAQPFVDLLTGGMSSGALAVLAADTALNQSNINLLGLSQTGLAYLPYLAV